MLQLNSFDSLKHYIDNYKKRRWYAHVFVVEYLRKNLVRQDKDNPKNTFYILNREKNYAPISSKIWEAITHVWSKNKCKHLHLEELVEHVLSDCLCGEFKIHPCTFNLEKPELKERLYQDKDFYYLFQDLSFSKYFNTIPNYMVHYVESKTRTKLNNGLFKISCISDLFASKEEKPSDLVPSAYLYQ